MFSKQNSLQYIITKFINHLMIDGKKNRAEAIFLETIFLLNEKENKKGLLVFFQALENVKPSVELGLVRRGGATYQVPIPSTEKRSLSLAMKWLIELSRKKEGSFPFHLAQSISEAAKNTGECVKKREALHSSALKNRSFSHLRWF